VQEVKNRNISGRAEAACLRDQPNSPKARGQKRQAKHEKNPNMKRILIAEDNAVNRELLRELLEARGYAVEEACNGLEALQMIAQSKPDALLLDLNMPVLDGFATVRKIRENPSMASLPVLAVTAYAMRGDREKTLSAGFDEYLSKPISSSALDAELERIWNKQQVESANPKQLAQAAGNET
jgi:CheY-like chemotaxis protein